MQGTGTQNDPLVPYEWDEVIEAIGTSGVYVKFPDTAGEYDMNTLYPEGVPRIRIRCTQINGNGWNIKNIYSTDSPFAVFGLCNIVRLNIVDFLHEGSDFFLLNENYYADGQLLIEHCKLSGIMSSGTLFHRNTRHSDQIFKLMRSSVNVRADNNAVVFGAEMNSSYAAVNNCNIKIVGNSIDPFGASYMYNCFVQGEMSPNQSNGIKLVSGSNYNIIVADLSQSASSALLACPNGINLINSDLLPAGTSIPAGMKGCTTEQLKDASYLAEDEEVGFPIGVG